MPYKSNKRQELRRTSSENRGIRDLIEKIRKEEIITPGDLANYRLRLAAEYSFLSEQLGEILREKSEIWMEIRQREEITSDKLADRVWEGTTFGKDEISLRLELKSIDKLMSSINTRLRTYEDEARHNY